MDSVITLARQLRTSTAISVLAWSVLHLVNGTAALRTEAAEPVHHLNFAELSTAHLMNVPIGLTVTAADSNNMTRVDYNGAFNLSAIGPAVREPSVMISEVVHDVFDAVEFINVSGATQNLNGWQIVIFDASATVPRVSITITNEMTVAPGEVFVAREGSGPVLPVKMLNIAANLNWQFASTLSAVVMLRDQHGVLVDMVSIGNRKLSALATVSSADWQGGNVAGPTGFQTSWSRQRAGLVDQSSAEDWVTATPQIGFVNNGLRVPFVVGIGAVALTTQPQPKFTNGVWSGTVTFLGTGANMFLEGTVPNGIASRSESFNVNGMPTLAVETAEATEGDGVMTNAVWLRLEIPLTTDTVATLTTESEEIELPASVVIPAGETELFVPVTVLDDTILDGTQNAWIQAGAQGVVTLGGKLPIHDNETAVLSLQTPKEILEGNVFEVQVTASEAPAKTVELTVALEGGISLMSNAPILLPAGTQAVTFAARASNDRILNAAREASVAASVQGWVGATNRLTLLDDETRAITVLLPTSLTENAGMLTNQGRIVLGGITETNLVVDLVWDGAEQLTVPEAVNVTAGASNAFFTLSITDDAIPEMNAVVAVSASAPGFLNGTAEMMLLDEDPTGFVITVPMGALTVGAPLSVEVRAESLGGGILTNGTYEVAVQLLSSNGVPLAPPVQVQMVKGIGPAVIVPETTAIGAYLRGERGAAVGESRRLNILEPVERRLAGLYRDFVLEPGSKDLLASVPSNAATNGNQIVRIDAETGLIETWISGEGLFPEENINAGKLAVSPDGTTILAITGNGSQVLAWNVATKALVKTFILPARPAEVIAVANGAGAGEFSLLVSTGWETYVFDSEGVSQYSQRSFESGIGHPERPETFYVYHPYSVSEWGTTTNGLAYGIELQSDIYQEAHIDLAMVGERLFTIAGGVIDTETREMVGELPVPVSLAKRLASGRLAADAVRGEIIRAYPENGFTRVEGFGANDLRLHREVVLPDHWNALKRLALVSSNRLAALNAGELKLIRWPLNADAEPVDLRVEAISLTETPRVGQAWNWTVQVTNKGPGFASDVQVEILVPAGASVTSVIVPGGEFILDNETITAHLPLLEPGQSVEIAVALAPEIGGYAESTVVARSNEEELDFGNNVVRLEHVVGLVRTPESVGHLRLAMRELAYDALREKIYALGRNAANATNTVLYEIDPATFIPQAVRNVPGYASALQVSGDSHYLHMAVLGGRSALRIDLSGGADLQYALGGEGFTLLAFEVLRSNPSAVLVAGTTELGEGVRWQMDISVFEDGVAAEEKVSQELHDRSYSASLESDASGEAYFSIYPQNTVQRLRVTESGVAEIGRYVRAEMSGYALVDGLMYTSFSDELVASTGKFLRGVPSANDNFATVLHQPEQDQLLYLQMLNGDAMLLQVFDRPSLALVGSFHIPAKGPASMVDLKDGRVAIATSSGDLFVVTSEALSGSAVSTDLMVRLEAEPAQPKIGQEVVIRVIVSNDGTNSPVAAGVTAELPVGFNWAFAETQPRPARSKSEFESTVLLLWTNVAVPPGSSVTNIIRGTFTGVGHMEFRAGVADRTADPDPVNNRTSLVLAIPYESKPGSFAVTAYQILAAGYDGTRGRIVAATRPQSHYSGRVIAINPRTGLVEETFDFGANVTAMALADDNETLYLAIDGGTNIARVNLATEKVEAVFSASFPEVGEQRAVYWLGTNPGRPDQLFVRADSGLALFARDQLVASTNYFYGPLALYAPNTMVQVVEYAPHPIKRVHFDGNQFLMSEVGPQFMSYLRGSAGLLVSSDGRVVDGESFNVIGQVEGGGAAVISSRESAIYNFAFEGNEAELRSFDIATQSLLWQTPVPAHPQGVEGFAAGPEFVAYRLGDGRLMIVQKPRAETNAAADLTVTLGTASTWRVGTIGTWDVTLQNSGPNLAGGARVDLRLPVGFRAVQVNGATVIADKTNHLVLNVGSMPANSGAALRISAVPDRAYTSTEVVASVRSSAADGNRSNNSARLAHGVESSSLPNLLETLDISGSDLVYDPRAKRLYVAGLSDNGILSSNLTVVDPATGTEAGSIELPGIPVKLAISGGSEFLYVALDGGATIVRYELPSLKLDLTFDIPVAAWFKVDMFVPVGSPRTVVMSLHGAGSPSPAGVWVYDDDQPRAKKIEGGWRGVTFIEPGAAPDELIAVGDTAVTQIALRKYRITAEGLEFVSEREHTDSPFALKAAGNTTLVWPAEVYDSSTLERRGTLPTGFARADFDPEAAALSQDGAHAVLAANVGMNVRFEGFRTDTMASSGAAEVPMVAPVRALALWEEDGVAALAGNSLILGRLDLAAAPLEIRQFDASSMRVIFPSASGRRWILQTAPTVNGPWSNAAEAISAGEVEVVPVNRAPDTNAFFRVVLQREP